eukprot:6664506-Prymnesium_polylepis.1
MALQSLRVNGDRTAARPTAHAHTPDAGPGGARRPPRDSRHVAPRVRSVPHPRPSFGERSPQPHLSPES